MGLCHDCVVLLLLHWVLGSAEWAEGQKHSEGDNPWASCHTSYTEREGKRERERERERAHLPANCRGNSFNSDESQRVINLPPFPGVSQDIFYEEP